MNYKQTQKFGVQSSVSLKKFNLFGGFLWLVYGIVVFLGIVNLVGSNALATQGVVLDNIIRQTDKISRDNQILSIEIGKVSNLGYIELTATKLGFKRVRSNLIISGNEAVAAVIHSARLQQ